MAVTTVLPDCSDEQLARSAQSGDWASFDELVRRYEVRIYRFVVNCCAGHEADARDVTQETFVSAFVHFRQYDPERSLATWLFTIARRKGIDRSRRPQLGDLNGLPEQPDHGDPAVLAERHEAREDIWLVAHDVLRPLQF